MAADSLQSVRAVLQTSFFLSLAERSIGICVRHVCSVRNRVTAGRKVDPGSFRRDVPSPRRSFLSIFQMFDLVWNACGYPASKNFDAGGNWITRR